EDRSLSGFTLGPGLGGYITHGSKSRDIETIGKAFAERAGELAAGADVSRRSDVMHLDGFQHLYPEIALEIDAHDDVDRKRNGEIADDHHGQHRDALGCIAGPQRLLDRKAAQLD